MFFRQLFQNYIPQFFGMDVILSSFILWLFIFSEGKRQGMKNLWVYVVRNLVVGVSLALTLFLFFREQKLSAEGQSQANYATFNSFAFHAVCSVF